jgi:hypothetical protein
MIKNILYGIGFFIGTDLLLKINRIEGRYYFNHVLCNSIVVYNTFNSMLLCYNTFDMINQIQITSLYNAKIIIYSLHLYHVLWYFNNLRRDDWIHHILMIGIVLPLTEIVPQNNIISHALFYTTGLPGLIDYTLLFLNRNNIINKYFEKRVNTFLNLWIRAPGCIMNTNMSIMAIMSNYNQLTNNQLYGSMIMASLVYWNGIYFMAQVLTDYNKTNQIFT